MTIVQIAPPAFVRIPRTSRAKPLRAGGEVQLSHALMELGIKHRYECFSYPLSFDETGKVSSSFMPDFWLPESARWPEMQIELTWADRYQDMPECEVAATRKLARKRQQVEQLLELYGLQTLLVTYSMWCEIMLNHEHLIELIAQLFPNTQPHMVQRAS